MHTDVTFEERRALYDELKEFVHEYVANMKNNTGAELFQFEKCPQEGAWYTCPVNGCMNADFYDCNRILTKAYGEGARLKAEKRADGEGYIVYLLVNLNHWKKLGGVQAKAGGKRGPAFQTLMTLFLADVVLVGALCWKLGLLGAMA